MTAQLKMAQLKTAQLKTARLRTAQFKTVQLMTLGFKLVILDTAKRMTAFEVLAQQSRAAAGQEHQR